MCHEKIRKHYINLILNSTEDEQKNTIDRIKIEMYQAAVAQEVEQVVTYSEAR